jgi:signal transduction histidine kinase
MFHEPSAGNPLGESAASNPVFQAASRSIETGVVEQSITSDGPVMISGFRAISSPPLIVAVSLDRNEILTDWRHQVIGSAILFAALAVMMTATLVVLFRQMDAEARARDELLVASRLKDEFLMTVSHELRTPLTAIYGWARMLNSGTLSDAQKGAALQTIERNARMQTKLIDDLLDMARIIEGKLQLQPRRVDIAEVVQHAIESVRPAADARHIRLEPAVPSTIGSVVADSERLQQVLSNLLSNAIKFTEPGGLVTLTATRAESSVEIAVADTGAGISAEFLPYVFDRFRQEQGGSRREYGGLGLGLAIARHLVELHGGTITAESAGTGRGATFRVRLPAGAPMAEANERTGPTAVELETS